MIGWLWALEGWQFIAATFTCAVSVIGMFIAGVGAIAKTIATSTEHDLYTCGCGKCRGIRDKAADRFDKNYNQTTSLLDWTKNDKLKYGAWISTAELAPGMLLTSNKGHIYKVEEIIPRDYGVALHLRNMVSNRLAWVTVHTDRMDTPMWRRAYYDERGN